MKKSLTFSFAMLLGVVVLLSPVSNALEADMSSSITYRPEDTQICYVSEIDEVISNTEIDKSVRQTVKERARMRSAAPASPPVIWTERSSSCSAFILWKTLCWIPWSIALPKKIK